MTTQSVQQLEDYVALQLEGSAVGPANTAVIPIDAGCDILDLHRIKVIRVAGVGPSDATNFSVEIRDDNTGAADDDNRWFYNASAPRTVYDGNPDSVEFVNRMAPPNRIIYVIVVFTGGTAVAQTYQATVWIKRIRQNR